MARPLRLRRAFLHVVVVLGAGLGIALGVDVLRSGGVETWLAARGLGPPYASEGRLIGTAGGRHVHLDCRGTGSPTVILDNGLGSGADAWGFVLPKIAERTRVCAYDRPGIGQCSPRPTHTVGETATELREVLADAGEDGPFVVVGMSLGGVYARVFAAGHRDEVVGVVLVDAYYPDGTWTDGTSVDPTWLADTAANVAATNRMIEGVESLDWPASRSELDDSRLDGIPLEVLAVDQHLRYQDERIPPDMEERIIESWREWCLSLSPGMTRITIADRSGHDIQFDRPDVVIDAIERLVSATRAARPVQG
jgi:pimeloyl-ACP methyl ester carboxylesterase